MQTFSCLSGSALTQRETSPDFVLVNEIKIEKKKDGAIPFTKLVRQLVVDIPEAARL